MNQTPLRNEGTQSQTRKGKAFLLACRSLDKFSSGLLAVWETGTDEAQKCPVSFLAK